VSEDGVAAQETEFETILARLRAEVERGGDREREERRDRFSLRREEAERLWAVSAERPFLYRAGPWGRARGLLLAPLKSVLRKLMRWYVEPFAVDQRRFNASVLKLADALSQRSDTGRAELQQALYELETSLGTTLSRLAEELRPQLHSTTVQAAETERRAVELEERLTRLERRGRAPVQRAAVPSAEAPALEFPDYFAFESRMRGSTESVRDRQRPYVEDFRGAEPVLDLGSGRGEFLTLLREAGVEARGLDIDADMVAYARGEGLEVEQTGAVEYLEGVEDGSLGGIFAAQLLEHLPAAVIVRLLELAAAKLQPGGVLVAETINPLSPIALRNYFADLTHAQPLVPETLELLARQAGFATVETRFLNEPEEKLAEPDDPTIAANVRRLNDLLFAPLDYAIVART
jgi:SAM-dependent methyltransferase